MRALNVALHYILAAVTSLVMAFFVAGLVSLVFFPKDGPVGEGMLILLIYAVACCGAVPGYFALMALHLDGNRGVRRLVWLELLLRTSVFVSSGFSAFAVAKLPTSTFSKAAAFAFGLAGGVWACNPRSWERKLTMAQR